MSTSKTALRTVLFTLAIASLGAGLGCSGSSGPKLGVGYDDAEQRILVTYGRELSDDETLHSRVRRGRIEDLWCSRDAAGIARIDGERVMHADTPTWRGDTADRSMFESLYDTSWLESEPTPEMLAEAAKGGYVIDVCLMGPDGEVAGNSFDIRRALDNTGSNGKFDGEAGERIRSTSAYAELCIAELGEIPFFQKLGDNDYTTYNCLESTAIPTTVTAADGTVTRPESQVNQCDNPQYIYSLCEPNAVDGRTNGPRVASRSNDQGTSWTILCRKSRTEEGAYNDIAMIGTNPYTGKTCFFQNALYSRTDGLKIPHPGDTVDSEQSPQQSATLWEGVHGGEGNGGIRCANCHSSDALIHTPWIDGAKDAAGDPVIPKMGVHPDFALGYNDAPYQLVNRAGQGWDELKQLVSPEVAACTRCHRIGADDRWMNDWNDRLIADDSSWTNITTESHRTFEHAYWMPPDVDGLEEATWEESDYGKAMRFILNCKTDNSRCIYAEIPTSPLGDGGSLPEIDLEGAELALASLKILGADVDDASCPGGNCSTRRCAECHSISRPGLKRWRELTDDAWGDCNMKKNPDEMSESEALTAVNCLRVDPDDGTSVFEAAKLGILTSGVQYGDFRRLFQKAYGQNWLIPYAGFKARVNMPKGSHPKLSQKEFATLIKWFDNGLDNLNEVLQEAPPPQSCTDSFNTAAISAHINDMKFDGWGAVNEENGIRMFGCPVGADPLQCFQNGTFPTRTSDWGTSNGKVIQLKKLGFRTSFWTRSSADGRFVGNGGGSASRSTITDLQTGRDIGIEASYDPGFFPDNSGWIFQGATGGAGICSQSLLETASSVDFSEPQCMNARGINLYQHVARGTGGGDYFIINSQFTSDSGQASQDPRAPFNASSTMKFTPMIFTGSVYEQLPETIVDSPYEGDSVLSPSSQLVASRLAGPDGRPLGYIVRRVNATKFGSSYQINISTKLATVCTSGAKVNFSFDERFMVTHAYRDGKADIILIDLLTGQRYDLTDMASGKYAQFPHFRSDGWLYFLVVDGDERYIAASDAAVRIAGQ